MIHDQAYTTSYLLKLAVGCYRLFVKPISRIDVEKLGKITQTHTQILVHRPIYHIPAYTQNTAEADMEKHDKHESTHKHLNIDYGCHFGL